MKFLHVPSEVLPLAGRENGRELAPGCVVEFLHLRLQLLLELLARRDVRGERLVVFRSGTSVPSSSESAASKDKR